MKKLDQRPLSDLFLFFIIFQNSYSITSQNMDFNKLLCCQNPKTGLILVAIFQIVCGLIPVIYLVTWNTVFIAIVCLGSSKLLFYGILSNNLTPIRISLYLSVIGVAFYVVGVVTSIVVIAGLDTNGPNFVEIGKRDIIYGIGMLIFAMLNIYFSICIYTFKNMLKF